MTSVSSTPSSRHLAVAALAGLLTLTGCGDQDEGLTDPGTELAFGETATIEYTDAEGTSGVFELTVESLEAGDESDLAELDLGDGETGGTIPYYLTATATAVDVDGLSSTAQLREDLHDSLHGHTAQEHRGSSLPDQVETHDWERCPSDEIPTDLAEGDRFSLCKPLIFAEDWELSSVQYQPAFSSGESGDESPIVWE